MYGLPQTLKHLSPAEERVLLAVWAAGDGAAACRADIAAALPADTPRWTDATLLNFLYRLEEKGWLKRGKAGNRNLYTPTVTRRAYGVAVMRERLDTLFGGDLAGAVYALVSETGASEAQLIRARTVLEEKIAAAAEYDLYDPYG